MMTAFRRSKNQDILCCTFMLLIQAAIVNWIAYNGGRAISHNLPHRCLATRIDSMIPVLSWTILIYWGGTVFWAVNYSLGAYHKSNGRSRMIMAHVIGEAVCFLAFVLLPTTMSRPEITGTTLFDQMLRLTYRLDRPDNLLPSIHCFESWLCWVEARKNPRIPGWYQHLSLFMAMAICVSTLTVKQHVLVDAVAGIALAEISYYFAERIILKEYEF